MQKLIFMHDISEYGEYIDREVIEYINEGQIETYESFDNHTIIAFDVYEPEKNDFSSSQILIYIDLEDIFFICENEASYSIAEKLFVKAEGNEEALYFFLRGLFRGGTERLENLESRVLALDDAISVSPKSEIAGEIRTLRNEIYKAYKFYEQMKFILEEICENDNNLISENMRRPFENMKNLSIRLFSLSSNLRQFIAQIKESYRAEIGIEQNKLMRVFTIVTSIFLPLTLIVGWYGMNFKIPEFGWEYGYAYVTAVCAVVTIIWFVVCKKKKWF